LKVGRRKTDDSEPSVVDLINSHFGFGEGKPPEETPLQRYRRTGKKLPPPNDPRTSEGREWIKANCRLAQSKKKRPRKSQAVPSPEGDD
jgi:hypothetical protein